VTSFYEDNPTYHAPLADMGYWPLGTPESQGLDSAVLKEGDKKLESLPQPLSFLVFRKGVLVWERYFHGSRVFHSNNVHSASKSILSALVGIAIREGLLSLDDTLGELLPRYKLTAAKKKITVRSLLTMTSGLEWTEDKSEYEIEEENDWIKAILDFPLKSPVGSKFLYSTGNTHVLSALLTESSGVSTCDFAHEHLFDPMGITVEHWGRDPKGYYSGGYNLYLTPRELAKFGQLYLQKGVWEGRPLVEAGWVQASHTAHQTVDAVRSYGYLWWLHQSAKGYAVKKMWGYGGQFVYLVPELELMVVTTADTKDEHAEMDGNDFVERYVLSALRP
jgi:CubicO group peptidase (beta-lactamase class C family)